jgi:hypothetical protein
MNTIAKTLVAAAGLTGALVGTADAQFYVPTYAFSAASQPLAVSPAYEEHRSVGTASAHHRAKAKTGHSAVDGNR